MLTLLAVSYGATAAAGIANLLMKFAIKLKSNVYRLESNGFTHSNCTGLYSGYSSSKRLNNDNKLSAMFVFNL